MSLTTTIINYLDQIYPDPKPELDFLDEYQLLVAVILSAQTTDKQVNKVTKELFLLYPTIQKLASARLEDVSKIIKSIGLYQKKAQNIILMANQVVNNFSGKIPNNLADLTSLAGVGRKSANVMLANYFNVNAFAVDTHVTRVSKRLGIADQLDSVLVIEQKLNVFFENYSSYRLHHQLILFGRYFCKARNPLCQQCGLKKICKYYQNLR